MKTSSHDWVGIYNIPSSNTYLGSNTYYVHTYIELWKHMPKVLCHHRIICTAFMVESDTYALMEATGTSGINLGDFRGRLAREKGAEDVD